MATQMVIADQNGKELVAPASARPSMTRILEMAMSPEVDANKLEKMMEMHFRWEKEEARKAYITAIQQFKSNPPEIVKSKVVDYANRDGSRTKYQHVELHEANKIISESLRAVGITASWKMTSDAQGRTFCTCILTHAMGHVEEVSTLSAPADTSGGKNNVQAIGSTSTYLERYTLLAGLGLTPEGMDDDARTSQGLESRVIAEYIETISQARSKPELKARYEAAKAAANACSDADAVAQFVAAADKRQKEINAGGVR